MAKNYPSKRPKWANFWQKISIFGVFYEPLELKINLKVGLLRPKTMPEHFLNNSKTTEKVQNTNFSTPKMAKNDPFKCQKWVNSESKRGYTKKVIDWKKMIFSFIFDLRIKFYNFMIFSETKWKNSKVSIFTKNTPTHQPHLNKTHRS